MSTEAISTEKVTSLLYDFDYKLIEQTDRVVGLYTHATIVKNEN